MATMMYEGQFILNEKDISHAVVGLTIAYKLRVGLSFITPATQFYRISSETFPNCVRDLQIRIKGQVFEPIEYRHYNHITITRAMVPTATPKWYWPYCAISWQTNNALWERENSFYSGLDQMHKCRIISPFDNRWRRLPWWCKCNFITRFSYLHKEPNNISNVFRTNVIHYKSCK